MNFETITPRYDGPERRCGMQRRKPRVDPQAEKMLHDERMCEIASLQADRQIKAEHGYDAAVLFWHLKMRHKHGKLQTFFPQGRYHIMLGMSEEELEQATQVLETAGLLKRTKYDGRTGYRILNPSTSPTYFQNNE